MSSAASLLVSLFLLGLSLALGIARPEVLLWAAAIGVVACGALLSALLLLLNERRLVVAIGRTAQVLDQAALSGIAPTISREVMDVRLVQLYRALNRFARKRQEQLEALDVAAERHRAILEALKEGIIVVDEKRQIVRMNSAAAQFLAKLRGTQAPAHAVGRPLSEALTLKELVDLVTRAFLEHAPQEGEIVTDDGGLSRYWMVHVRLFGTEAHVPLGVVVVLTDVTRLKRLETLRRDFVANVSHELKTPMTSISASVETLLDGALEDPDAARNFVSMIGRQAERLNLIFEDLLSLSRIEQESEQASIAKSRTHILPILEAAQELCLRRAGSKGTEIFVECSPDMEALVNQTLMQQAVVNLIDNAVKYSRDGGTVWVRALALGDKLEIKVEDNGAGIAAEHVPRLFERFYRADAARSRSEGGTGLGLAIVKHIAQAHGGQVSVTSELGKGSTFVIEVPMVG